MLDTVLQCCDCNNVANNTQAAVRRKQDTIDIQRPGNRKVQGLSAVYSDRGHTGEHRHLCVLGSVEQPSAGTEGSYSVPRVLGVTEAGCQQIVIGLKRKLWTMGAEK